MTIIFYRSSSLAFFGKGIFEVGFVSADGSFIGVVVNVRTQNYEAVVEVVALYRVDTFDLVDGVGGS